MLNDVIPVLACPQCGGSLVLHGTVLGCDSGHAFDVARQGYVNLLPGRATASTADTPSMIAARKAFLDAGHFEPIADAVVSAARAAVPDTVGGAIVDAGAGTGYALGRLLDVMPQRAGVALDISKYAARVAARSHERTGAIVADVWTRFPLRDGCAAVVLDIFSPRNAEEFARILSPGGALIVVTPDPDHLSELVVPLGLITVDPRKSERLSVKLGSHFEHTDEHTVRYRLTLTRADAVAAAAMGPSAAHVSKDDLAGRVAKLADPLAVTVSVTVGTYRTTRQSGARV